MTELSALDNWMLHDICRAKKCTVLLGSVDILVSRYESRPTGINGCHNGIRVPVEAKEE